MQLPTLKTNMIGGKKTTMNEDVQYLLSEMVIFQGHLSFRGCISVEKQVCEAGSSHILVCFARQLMIFHARRTMKQKVFPLQTTFS